MANVHFVVPLPDSWTFEQGAQITFTTYTACQMLFESLCLPTPPSTDPAAATTTLLVYGASSAVGLRAIQIAKAIGYQVFAVCSPKNHNLVKSIGADATFDYKEPDVGSKIKTASGGKIQLALDPITGNGSGKIIAQALSSEGGKIATLFFYGDEDKAALGSNVTANFSASFDLFFDVRARVDVCVKWCLLLR